MAVATSVIPARGWRARVLAAPRRSGRLVLDQQTTLESKLEGFLCQGCRDTLDTPAFAVAVQLATGVRRLEGRHQTEPRVSEGEGRGDDEGEPPGTAILGGAGRNLL